MADGTDSIHPANIPRYDKNHYRLKYFSFISPASFAPDTLTGCLLTLQRTAPPNDNEAPVAWWWSYDSFSARPNDAQNIRDKINHKHYQPKQNKKCTYGNDMSYREMKNEKADTKGNYYKYMEHEAVRSEYISRRQETQEQHQNATPNTLFNPTPI